MDFTNIINNADPRLSTCSKQDAPLNHLNGLVAACKCYQVYDGDTCRVAMCYNGKLLSWKARIAHIDTPELKTKNPIEKTLALAAKQRLMSLIDQKVCCVKFGKFESFGRVLVDIINSDGINVKDCLITECLGYAYEGVTKNKDWDTLTANREAYLSSCEDF
jgi:endonuclease YncB( thermonuclease family)